MKKKVLRILIVGRPNVGKSTFANRLIGRRQILVHSMPGVTRDSIEVETEWEGVRLVIRDTGGLYRLPGRSNVKTNLEDNFDEELQREIFDLIKLQLSSTDVVFFMVDGREGIHRTDVFFADFLQKSGVPVWVIVNKLDRPDDFDKAYHFFEWGMPVYPVSSEAGLGIGELLSNLVKNIKPKKIMEPDTDEENIISVAIVGRPNVGKSTLINSLLKEKRMITSNVPGTTRDSVDLFLNINNRTFRLIDTAGIFKKRHRKKKIEQIAMIKSVQAIKKASVAVLLLDALEGPKDQDHHIADYIDEAGTGGIVAINKWDLLETPAGQFDEWKLYIKNKWKTMEYAEIVRLSAVSRLGFKRLFKLIEEINTRYHQRLTTNRLNRIFEEIVYKDPPPAVKGKFIKLKYITQVSTAPPVFVIFSNRPSLINKNYKKFLTREIRRQLELKGVPVRLVFRGGNPK